MDVEHRTVRPRRSGRNKHRRFSVDSDSDSDAEARRALVRDSTATGGKDDKDPNSLLGTILGISNPVVRQRKEMGGALLLGISSVQARKTRAAKQSSSRTTLFLSRSAG